MFQLLDLKRGRGWGETLKNLSVNGLNNEILLSLNPHLF